MRSFVHMKVYFSASKSNAGAYEVMYKRIVAVLEASGLTVLETERLKSKTGAFLGISDAAKVQLYKSMIQLMDKADMSVFEASFPSTIHVGHEITLSLERGKPVVVLYREGREPILFKGMKNDRIIWVEYNDENLETKLESAVDEAKKNMDVRFNFFVSPKLLTYLDWVSQHRMIPRSVFLRNLIEREMKKDKEFK